MIFHENCLLADNSHKISYLIFFRKLRKMLPNLSSAAVVIGPLRIKDLGSMRSNHVIRALSRKNLILLHVNNKGADQSNTQFEQHLYFSLIEQFNISTCLRLLHAKLQYSY